MTTLNLYVSPGGDDRRAVTRVVFGAALTALLLFPLALSAATYHVSPGGDDANPGTRQKPFRTIQKAADSAGPGDTCLIQAGAYRETITLTRSGEPDKPIRFMSEPGQIVTLDGTTPIVGDWVRHTGDIYRIKVEADIEQLFVNREMMIEARWPNMRFDQLFDRKTWRPTSRVSCHGTLVDPELAQTGVDWTGALVMLNVAHQYLSWSRTVESHGIGNGALTYARNLPGLADYETKEDGWDDDYYFLSGKLEALDAPTEWFYDRATKQLYLYAPGGDNPGACKVEYRQRQYAFTGNDLKHVELDGLRFFACSFQFTNCSDLLVDGCRLQFPTFSRRLTDVEDPKAPMPITAISGDRNTIRHCLLEYAGGAGLSLEGDSNLVENCIIHDVCWNGSLRYAALRLKGKHNIARRNTLYNAGNAVLCFRGENNRIEYNHVYDGGLLCRDVSLIYTSMPDCRGSVVCHNWVHGCHTEGFVGKGQGGIGIRGDDQTRGLTVHHNVVWDCGGSGILVKGDDNRVFNNTTFEIGGDGLLIPSEPEPRKPWAKQAPLLDVQNANSVFFNNAVNTLAVRGKPLPENGRISDNRVFETKPANTWLLDPARMDFRPSESSGLVDAGKVEKDLKADDRDKAPDIGAYEASAKAWTAGADWQQE